MPKKKEKEDDDDGFLSGLEAGSNALVIFAIGLATVIGAVLPWAIVLLMIGGRWLFLRRLRRREPCLPGRTDA